MIKFKKIGLIVEENVFIDSILKNGMVIRVPCQIIGAEYDRLFLKFPPEKIEYAQYFYEGKTINVTLDTLDGRRIYRALILYEPKGSLIVVEYYPEDSSNQKREHFRVKATKLLDVNINGAKIHAVTIDISSGGFRILLAEELKENEEYEATFILNQDEPPINLSFRIRHIFFISSEYQYENSCEFVKLTEQDQKRITKFCFDMQTKFINKHSYED